MVRSYQRHGQTECFSVIHSPNSRSVYTTSNLAYVAALEDVLVWDCKLGEQVGMWHIVGLKALVSCITQSPARPSLFAVGYSDGSIRLWQDGECTVTLDGHKKQVTALCFDQAGSKLASGSQDCDVIVWDVLGETGLYRLRGHRDQLTSLLFLSPDHLLSGGKDTLLKLWHLPTQHCLDTAIAHRSACWSAAVLPLDEEEQHGATAVVLTGGSEGELKLWDIALTTLEAQTNLRSITPLPLPQLSSVSHAHRIQQVTFDPISKLLGVQTAERTVEFARIRTLADLKKKAQRRKKREKEKGREVAEDEAGEEQQQQRTWADRLSSWTILRAPSKIRSFAFASPTSARQARGKTRSAATSDDVHVLLALNNNSLQTYSVPLPSNAKSAGVPEATQVHTVALAGHRTDVRALAVSFDDNLIASASHGELKIWNRRSLKCLRTILDVGYALCVAWLPGDRHILVGTKSGSVELYDISSSSLIQSVPAAHAGAVWAIQLRPNGQGFVSGSADKSVKFWDFVVKEALASEGASQKTRSLSMVHRQTLKMSDDVLSVRYSPDSRLLAVALLDSTVKVFYADTLKFFVSLYGHKLPVLNMDISFDSKLLITCSADKNIKIWGLDYGDCHKSIFAHDDAVMSVAFEADSHYYWSVSKDAAVKYWDGDKFDMIQKLEGHYGEVWAIAPSRKGRFVVTAGADKSIRLWEKTDEPLFLEEERERELEALYDSNLPTNDPFELVVKKGGEADEAEAAGPEATDVRKQTADTLTAGEKIMDALELSAAERELFREYEKAKAAAGADSKMQPPPRNPILAIHGPKYSSERYVLDVVSKVPSAGLHDALLVLPFSKVALLVEHLDHWARHGWNVALTSRILFFLLKTHHSQIVATQSMRDTLLDMRKSIKEALGRQKDTMGYNLAALSYLRRQHEESKTSEMDMDDAAAVSVEQQLDGGKKRKRTVI